MTKPKLMIHVEQAKHFLEWEMPHFQNYFDVVDTPSENTILFAFGPDAFTSGIQLPASKRVALLFPGFSYNPYYNPVHRYGMLKLIDDHYDLVFVNPGPIHEAFKNHPKIQLCNFSINTDLIGRTTPRTKLTTLLHASADHPQKDWRRSLEVMQLTGLTHEVFPPRDVSRTKQLQLRLMKRIKKLIRIKEAPTVNKLYLSHQHLIEKYRRYDGFVHIAGKTPPLVDGKYTATLLEAGLTGCILFWHDTHELGNDFETIFSLPLDPAHAAREILNIRQNIDVRVHSRRTAEEIYERCNPANSLRIRSEKIYAIL